MVKKQNNVIYFHKISNNMFVKSIGYIITIFFFFFATTKFLYYPNSNYFFVQQTKGVMTNEKIVDTLYKQSRCYSFV